MAQNNTTDSSGALVILISVIFIFLILPGILLFFPQHTIAVISPDNPTFIQGYKDALNGNDKTFMAFIHGSPGLFLAYNITELLYYSGWLTEHYDVAHNNTERLDKYRKL
jgi:hypothetical protein